MSFTCSSEIISSQRTREIKNLIFFSEENCFSKDEERKLESINLKNQTNVLRKSRIFTNGEGLKNSSIGRSKGQTKIKLKFVLSRCLPYMIGSSIFFLIAYIDLVKCCDSSSIWLWIFQLFYEAIFDVGFYSFLVYHMLFPHLFKRMANKTAAKILRFFILLFLSLNLIVFSYFVKKNYLEDFMIMHLLNLLVSNLIVCCLCKLGSVKFMHIKQNYFLFCFFVLFSIVNYYILKKKVILLLKVIISQEYNILFKFCLFLYFNGIRALFRSMMIQYIKLYDHKNKNEIEYGTIIFYKFFLSDLMSSVLIPALINTDDNFLSLLNIILFTYQILIIYLKEDPIIKSIWRFFYFIFNIKKNEDDEDLKISSLNLLLFSFNELMIVMHLKILVLYNTSKFLISTSFIATNQKLHIRLEMIILLIAINFFAGSLAQFTNTNLKIMIKKGKSKIFKDVYHIIAMYFYLETIYQFYLSVNTA